MVNNLSEFTPSAMTHGVREEDENGLLSSFISVVYPFS
jgi:hypothetical protein